MLLFLMLLHRGAVVVSVTAEHALERFLAGMRPHVDLHNVLERERLLANFTLERHLAGVLEHVHLQMGRLLE